MSSASLRHSQTKTPTPKRPLSRPPSAAAFAHEAGTPTRPVAGGQPSVPTTPPVGKQGDAAATRDSPVAAHRSSAYHGEGSDGIEYADIEDLDDDRGTEFSGRQSAATGAHDRPTFLTPTSSFAAGTPQDSGPAPPAAPASQEKEGTDLEPREAPRNPASVSPPPEDPAAGERPLNEGGASLPDAATVVADEFTLGAPTHPDEQVPELTSTHDGVHLNDDNDEAANANGIVRPSSDGVAPPSSSVAPAATSVSLAMPSLSPPPPAKTPGGKEGGGGGATPVDTSPALVPAPGASGTFLTSLSTFASIPSACPPAVPTDAALVLPESATTQFRGLRGVPVRTTERVLKVNKAGKRQDRVVVVTNSHLMTALPNDGDIQRSIDLDRVSALRLYRPNLQMVIEIPSEYDIMFIFQDADSLLRVLSCITDRAVVAGVTGSTEVSNAMSHPVVAVQEETDPIDSKKFRLEKPAGFVRVPLPTMKTQFPAWRADGSHDRHHARTSVRGAAVAASRPMPVAADERSVEPSNSGRVDDASALGAMYQAGERASSVGHSGRDRHVANRVTPVKEAPEPYLTATPRRNDGVSPGGAGDTPRHSKTGSIPATSARLTPAGHLTGADSAAALDAIMGRNASHASLASLRRQEREDRTPKHGTDGHRLKKAAATIADQAEEIESLRNKLRAEQVSRFELQQDIAEILRAKSDAEVVLRQELDSVRLMVDRLSAENLRLRRPWALDM